ncbi:collectin-12-like [Oncorhynchus mykiss]|uniref:collectin-12-like n=1 Tax=Oncorhynchus mykiss TaxID=8022 RepID=UPI001877D6C9|nr:collectin-12-like [Oncorhynchus mykiss]
MNIISVPVVNVALKGVATQSSIYLNGNAPNAIDGNRESDGYKGSCTHTAYDTNPWWRVDLLDVYRVTAVNITNRGDCCHERLNGTEIRIGNSLENNGINNPRCFVISLIQAGKTKTVQCNEMEGRYVVAVIPGRSEWLSLCEVEVYGTPREPITPLPSTPPTTTTIPQSSLTSSSTSLTSTPPPSTKSPASTPLPSTPPPTTTIPPSSPPFSPTYPSSSQSPTMTFLTFSPTYPSSQSPTSTSASTLLLSTSTPPPPSTSVTFLRRKVMVVREKLCWSDALFYCRDHDWDLVSVRNEKEQRELEKLVNDSNLITPLTSHLWLSLRRYILGDTWYWMTGDHMNYTHWVNGVPPRKDISNPCGAMTNGANGGNFLWAERLCDDHYNFLCYSGPEAGVNRVYFYSSRRP